ncbi:hypothetical protein GmHk_07G020657 [Glycine max]|nr:hypothetical protein GmHk_07G020657 [Glycine max]
MCVEFKGGPVDKTAILFQRDNFVRRVPQDPTQHFLQHRFNNCTAKEGQIWRMTWAAVVWNVWGMRNRCIFQREVVDYERLKQDIKFSLWSWLKMAYSEFIFSFVVWQTDPGTRLNIIFISKPMNATVKLLAGQFGSGCYHRSVAVLIVGALSWAGGNTTYMHVGLFVSYDV